ncbi:MAG: hypothetical protein U5L04_05285 [Trueperaceae bacterium]|nr:hypothetical protein [Trueperaceae bacterium]
MTVAVDTTEARGTDWSRLFDDVRARVSCLDLYRHFGTTNVPDGRTQASVRCIAPEHPDQNPSMSLGETGFKCHSCGASGDVVGMWALVHGLDSDDREDRKQSVLELADFGRLSLDDYQTNGPTRRGRRRPRARRQTPPAKQRQNSGNEGVPRARRELFKRLWQIVDPIGLTDQARDWLDSRGLGTGTAHMHGVRDWTPKAAEIGDVLRDSTPEALQQSGFLKDNGELWRPLEGNLTGESWAQGAMIPVWHPDHPEAPVAVRLRLYDPFSKGGRRVKALAQPRRGLNMPHLPLGLLQPPPHVARLQYWWPHHGPEAERERWRKDTQWRPLDDSTTPPYSVVLCEGEPDWLSVADALADYRTAHRVAPIGICTMSSGWPKELTPLLAGAERVVCLFDVGPDKGDQTRRTGEKVADDVGKALIEMAGREHTRRIYRRCLLSDDRDANDLHRDGELMPLLEQLLDGML